MRDVPIALFAAGEKGAAFLSAILQAGDSPVVDVFAYEQAGTLDESLERIRDLCSSHGIPLHVGRRKSPSLTPAELIFVVGWQYLLESDPRIVVFHDSLLPRYRGFAPTVTALINGDEEIGVTALRPVAAADAGPILAQHAQRVVYPARIRDVLTSLNDSYLACARSVIVDQTAGALTGQPQDESRATYSIWRDDDDYLLDWTADAGRIVRSVDALGWPYPGARTLQGERTITVLEVERGPDLVFEVVQPGKIWSIVDGHPLVVCGTGTVLITRALDDAGRDVTFDRIRTRLG